MFCKWCGEVIQETDGRCKACGRETPPMSDCGGLYTIKHSDTVATTITPGVARCPFSDKLETRYEKDKKSANRHHISMLVCLTAVLIALTVLSIISVLLAFRILGLEEKIEHLSEIVASQDLQLPTDSDEEKEQVEDTEPGEEIEPTDAEPATEEGTGDSTTEPNSDVNTGSNE